MAQNSQPLFSDFLSRLNPTKAFYIHHEKHHSTNIINITAQLAILYTLEIGITETSLNTARAIATAKPPLPSTYSVAEENLFNTRYSLRNLRGEVVADSRKKVLSLGKATFSFPDQSEAIEVKPRGVKNEIQEFAIDGVKYRYEVEKGVNGTRRYDSVLYKEKIGGMIEVARYNQKDKFMSGGLLLLDSGKVDEKVAILIACYGDGI